MYSVAGPLSELVLSIHLSPLQPMFLPPLHSYIQLLLLQDYNNESCFIVFVYQKGTILVYCLRRHKGLSGLRK